jgi:hypothetical protein
MRTAVPHATVRTRAMLLLAFAIGNAFTITAHAQSDDVDNSAVGAFSFAVVATDTTSANEHATQSLLRVIDGDAARFVVHFELSEPSPNSCADAALERRHDLLDASAKPVVPIVSASEWANCGVAGNDAFERLQHVGEVLFANDQSLGRARMPWFRQSALPRFRRYRENLRWQVGRVLFASLNLPNNNNDFRIGAGRNGEFEERLLANKAWLERTFRLAAERKLAGIVLFVDAAPRFSTALRPPDTRSRERDGYYEWKLALRELTSTFKGKVLLVQARYAPNVTRPSELDHPLRDAAGRPLENFFRIAPAEGEGGAHWMRIEVDPTKPKLFSVTTERVFDDPSGELYGPGQVK